ncbi:Peptide methionine sulfoxide reductase MsrA [Propionispora sp. 2/2-37]|uniref:peptide-methionine (S)-S-oxide reductase MsrA n=1 Tax=Propionispora sp. 2/2-37 TaxID=1677858 RepID=UPI0006BB82A4|nr:peptide-methionine (S)-S-oxide reductase MsrA [Propionispora sp. 2/2-37]CUH94986.1 Peptide methionine sulfoxide reductase MsrA [Propionispora sp. 2/2-37]
MKKLWLAGGCFWGVEAYFQQLRGVLDTTVGYGQGQAVNPSYEQVCSGTTGHAEICELTYDEKTLPLTKVLEHFFRIIDPTSLNCQGADCGTQYRTGIYFLDKQDKPVIEEFIKTRQTAYEAPIVVEIEPLACFYRAEDYHQDYLKNTPGGYCHVDLTKAIPEERR